MVGRNGSPRPNESQNGGNLLCYEITHTHTHKLQEFCGHPHLIRISGGYNFIKDLGLYSATDYCETFL